jgi:hypothetical protein
MPFYLNDQLSHIYTTLSNKREEILTMDNSSLCVWEDCCRKFLYRVLLNLREPEEKAAITFGKATHSFLELYHGGFDFTTAFEGFVKTALFDNSKISVTRVDSIDKGQIQEYSMEFGFVLCKKYAQTHPVDQEYFLALKDGLGKPYLETGFALDLPNGIIIGLIDMIAEICSTKREIVVDHKTTKHNLNTTWFTQFNPNNQISTYLYAASEYLGREITTAVINAIRVKDYKRGDPEDTDTKLFGRIETSRSFEQLEQRMRHANFQLGQISRSIDAGIDGFPLHTFSCNTKYGDCEYMRLCKAKDDRMLQILAETTYKIEKWVPYEVLQDSEADKVIDIDIDLDDHKKNKIDLVEKEKFLHV